MKGKKKQKKTPKGRLCILKRCVKKKTTQGSYKPYWFSMEVWVLHFNGWSKFKTTGLRWLPPLKQQSAGIIHHHQKPCSILSQPRFRERRHGSHTTASNAIYAPKYSFTGGTQSLFPWVITNQLSSPGAGKGTWINSGKFLQGEKYMPSGLLHSYKIHFSPLFKKKNSRERVKSFR